MVNPTPLPLSRTPNHLIPDRAASVAFFRSRSSPYSHHLQLPPATHPSLPHPKPTQKGPQCCLLGLWVEAETGLGYFHTAIKHYGGRENLWQLSMWQLQPSTIKILLRRVTITQEFPTTTSKKKGYCLSQCRPSDENEWWLIFFCKIYNL